ncbi:MAG: sigma-54-dependent Fis family transcriptional regulator [Spirochaetes bacterium]|nr:sigma-54-dependent Fis family transcriptional regulator [Spirochaetota bacterium]
MKILVVDDEKNITESIVKYLKLEKIKAEACSNGLSAKRILEEEVFDAAIFDLKMPGMSGIELLKWIHEQGPSIPVIIMSAYGEINDAVESMKLGAKDYIVKPFDPEELFIRIKRIVEENLIRQKVESGKSAESGINFIGETKEINKIKQLIEKAANTPSNVLITGESGTGKEIVARLLHEKSDRKNNNFVPVNIGGIQENLLESELFGYEKGAFTGADNKKIGLFELSSNGTLFLDEIGDMSFNLQIKLLRVLQDKKIMRLGGLNYIPINVRFISATNKNLENLIKENKFREDLFFRLNVFKIELPPLRDRAEDIPLLTGYLIQKFNKIFKKNIKSINNEALKLLQSYNYPGNVRELENIIERAFIYCESETITTKEIDLKMDNRQDKIKTGKIKDLEKKLIIEALQKWEGNKTKAADELGFTRRTLFNKLKEYKIK